MTDPVRPAEPAASVPAGARSNRIWTADFVKISLANSASFGSFNLLLATLPLYVVAIGGSESDVGLIMGVFGLMAVVGRPFVGAALDKFGRKSVLVVAMVGMVVSSLSYMVAFTVLALLFVRALHGISFAGAATTAAAYVGDIVPPRRRAEGVGYYGIFGNVTLALGPWISLQIVNVAGFTVTFAAAAAVAAAGIAISLSLRGLPSAIKPVELRPWFRRLVNPKAFRPALVLLCFGTAFAAQIVFLPIYASQRNLGDVGPYFFAFAVSSIVLRLVTGSLADRRGRGAAVIPGLMFAFVSMIVMSLATDMLLVVIAGTLYGAGFSLVMPALNALVVDVTTPADRGSAMATFTAAVDAGFGLGSFLWGFVIQQIGFQSMYLWGSIVPLLGILAYFLLVYGKMKPVESPPAFAPFAETSR